MNPETRLHLDLVRWWSLACKAENLDERVMLHFANGGKRRPVEAAILQGMGVRRGAPDLVIIVPRGTASGLAMELKAPEGRLSNDQEEMLDLFEKNGWAKVICWSFDEAVRAICCYLKTGDPLSLK